MKGKQLFILLLLAAVAGGAWYYLGKENRGTWSDTGGGGGKVVEFPINEVAQVKLKNASGELHLVKKNDLWTVQERVDYPANFEQVSGLLRKLWELKTVQEVKVGASQLSRLELEEPGKGEKAGTIVELINADGKTLATLLLGKPFVRKSEGGGGEFADVGFPTGRYVKVVGAPKVSLVADSLTEVKVSPETWLLKDFVKVEGPRSITVGGATDAQKWSVTRESATAEWKLADAKPDEKVDSNKAFPLGTILSSPTFDDVLPPGVKPEDTGLDKPTVATIETFDGFRYEVKIGKVIEEKYPVLINVSANLPKERTPGKDEKPEDKQKLDEEFQAKLKKQEEKLAAEQKLAGRAYLLSKSTIEPLLKDRAALFPDKPAEPAQAPTPPAAGALPVPGEPTVPATPVPAPAPPAPAPSAPAPENQ